jgi:hypothetical protein
LDHVSTHSECKYELVPRTPSKIEYSLGLYQVVVIHEYDCPNRSDVNIEQRYGIENQHLLVPIKF